jgi:Spy/CpxP family protein refolding chaperone
MKLFAFALVLSVLAPAAVAQSPYAGMQTRPIKALSEQQIADLKNGRGMGLAMPAELNGYPGPAHVLEFADQLALSAEQRTSVRTLFGAMKAEAIPLGDKLLAQEADLDHLFATHLINEDSLKIATAEIGATQAVLRDAHLKYHLLTARILTPDQTRHYSMLRATARTSAGNSITTTCVEARAAKTASSTGSLTLGQSRASNIDWRESVAPMRQGGRNGQPTDCRR